LPGKGCSCDALTGRAVDCTFALAILGLGAIVVTHWHDVIVALVVVAVLALAAVPVLLLWHNRRRHYDPELEQRAALERAQPPAVPAPATAAALEAAPTVVHQHLHLHGLSDPDVAAITRRAFKE
jgi:hypothetical protein